MEGNFSTTNLEPKVLDACWNSARSSIAGKPARIRNQADAASLVLRKTIGGRQGAGDEKTAVSHCRRARYGGSCRRANVLRRLRSWVRLWRAGRGGRGGVRWLAGLTWVRL